MSLRNLDNLVKTGQLKTEEFNRAEFNGLMHSGKTRLKDANNTTLAEESRFDLAYNAAHSIALAALRWHGYRSVNRYLIFQVLPYTLEVNQETWRILASHQGYQTLINKTLRESMSSEAQEKPSPVLRQIIREELKMLKLKSFKRRHA